MIAIYVKGGVVQQVYTDKIKEDAYILIDQDNIDGGDKGFEVNQAKYVPNLSKPFEGKIRRWLVNLGL